MVTRKNQAQAANENPKNPLLKNVNEKLSDMNDNEHVSDVESENLISPEESRLEESENEQPPGNLDQAISQSTPVPPEARKKVKAKNLEKETRYNKMKIKIGKKIELKGHFFQKFHYPAVLI